MECGGPSEKNMNNKTSETMNMSTTAETPEKFEAETPNEPGADKLSGPEAETANKPETETPRKTEAETPSKTEAEMPSTTETETPSRTEAVPPAKPEDKESLEDRYNKFRVYAVKLRNKVSDLTEQLQKLQAEKIRIEADREDLQNRIGQISDNAKKLQTIQSEYDKALDSLEREKNENRQITRNLEIIVGENASLKELLYESKESVTRLTGEVDRLSKVQLKLETVIKQSQDTIKELKDDKKADQLVREQKDKEYEEMKNSLNLEKEAHKATKAKLETIKQECNTKSVLSLEVHNYEISVEDLQAKLDDESLKRINLEKTVDEYLGTISDLESQISELKDTCLAKANLITVLGEKNEGIKQELCEERRKINEQNKLLEQLRNEIGLLNGIKSELEGKIRTLTSERDQVVREMQHERTNVDDQIKDLESKIAVLNATIVSREQELESLRREFLGYKLRAQSVLRTKQSQNKDSGRSIAEAEEELDHARTHSALLRDKLDTYTSQVESLTRELAVIKEERDHATRNEKESNQKLLTLHQDLFSVREQLRSSASKIQEMERQHQEAIESLKTLHEHNISELEERYQRELRNMQIERQKISLTDSNHSIMVLSVPDKSGDNSSENDHNSRMSGMVLLEREEGEGSESVDSALTTLVNTEKPYRHSLMPLDELLNTSDDYQFATEPLSQNVDQKTLEVCERRVRHLTVLLSDAEKDIAKLTQLNQVLKEDIRRQQRSVERGQHANNFEYLKNIVFKFVTLKNGDERSHLIPVLTTILKLSPEETQKLNVVAGVSGRSWIPGIPGWNN